MAKHPKLVSKRRRFVRAVAQALKLLVSSVALVAIAAFAALGADSYMGWHRITSVENLKGQCYQVDHSDSNIHEHTFIVETDNKKFRFGYGVTLDDGRQVYVGEHHMKDGIYRVDCEIFYNMALRYTEMKEQNATEAKPEETK